MKTNIFYMLVISYIIPGCWKEDEFVKLSSGGAYSIVNKSGSFIGNPVMALLGTDFWITTNPLIIPRSRHTATLLTNGKVLVIGGFTGNINNPVSTETAELYDPITTAWEMTGSLSVPRSSHTATLLPDGKVLVAGGRFNNMATATAEIFDANTGSWVSTGSMNFARFYHTATLLENGKILVTGGLGGNGIPTGKTAEVYDPVSGSWLLVDHMATIRWGHSATLLENGMVLVAGGSGPAGDGIYTRHAEIYDPIENVWHNVGNLNTPRGFHATIRLNNGCVLVAGGLTSPIHQNNITSTAEYYNPVTEKWTPIGSMSFERIPGALGSVLLSDGQFLVAGGHSITTESYDAEDGVWTLRASMNTPRTFHTVTKLSNGTVLAIGGENQNGFTSSVELYHPYGMGFE